MHWQQLQKLSLLFLVTTRKEVNRRTLKILSFVMIIKEMIVTDMGVRDQSEESKVVEEVAEVVVEAIMETEAKTTNRDPIIMRNMNKGKFLHTTAMGLMPETVVEVGLDLLVQIQTARAAIIQPPSLLRIHLMATTNHPTTSSIKMVV